MASQRLLHNYELASRSRSDQEVWFWSSSQALLPQKLRGRGSLKYRSRLHQMVHNSWNLNVRSTRGVGMCLWNWPKTQIAKYGRCCRVRFTTRRNCIRRPAERIDQHLPKENMFFCGLGAGHGGSSWVEVVICFIILRRCVGLHGLPPWSTVQGEPPGRLRPTDEEMQRRERVLRRC